MGKPGGMSKGSKKLTWGRMQEQPKEGMEVKEEVMQVPCSLMRVIYKAFISIHLVPVAFDPVPHFNLLTVREGPKLGYFQRWVG